MTRADLNRAVARATGETVDIIDGMGFQLVTVPSQVPLRFSRRGSSRPRKWRYGSAPKRSIAQPLPA